MININWKIKSFIILFFFAFLIYLTIKPYINFVNQELKISIIKTLFSKDSLKTYNNQVNILLLGIAGENHDGPNLSDSINVINYNFKNNILTTISIPRDIWSPTLKDKINSAYAYGEAKKPESGGFILAKAEISEIVGMPIQYATVINFEQFKELIDYLGGIDIKLEKSFIDKKFPIKGKENDNCNGDPEYKCRYETIIFKKGPNHMNGETALKFIRSRHAEGEEGTDFAREKRQQKVIEAIKNKIIEKIKKFNIEKYKETYFIFNKLIKRDISNQQISIILKNILLNKNFQQKKIILDEAFFINPPLYEYNNLWVLIPKNNNYLNIHQYIQCNLKSEKNCEKLKK
ncbi:MAG: LCP family protein [Patescibacteria group bacterium]|nr:LCP family protein [Patescibacteria group bacterium]